MYNNKQAQVGKAELAMSLGGCLGTTFAFYVKAHGFHWNVKGQDFVEFHDLFSKIYEDALGAIDPLAENILMLGYDAPATMSHLLSLSVIEENDNESTDDPVEMSASLLQANNALNEHILRSFALANNINEQGIANFLAERDAAHKKWAWQLRAITGMQVGGQLMGAQMDGVQIEIGDDESYNEFGFFAAGSKPAPKKDRIKGSSVNPKGSAAGGRSIKFSQKTETALMNKVKEHNEKAPAGRKATLAQLKAVYRRGAGAFSSSHRPGKTRDQWAMARVNAYLHLLRSGRPSNPNYKQDNDLLPNAHPKSTASITAAAAAAADELYIELREQHEYDSTEHALTEFAEYSGLGYEIIPSLRAAWKRGVENNENGFDRARELATMTYDSVDSDLLPNIES